MKKLTEKQEKLANFILKRAYENQGHTMTYEFGASEITDKLGLEYFFRLTPTMEWLQEQHLLIVHENGEVWLTALGESAARHGVASHVKRELRLESEERWARWSSILTNGLSVFQKLGYFLMGVAADRVLPQLIAWLS